VGIIIIMSWCIWMERNDLIFKGVQLNLFSVKERFKKESAWLLLEQKTIWIDSVLLFLFSYSFPLSSFPEQIFSNILLLIYFLDNGTKKVPASTLSKIAYTA
jgi:hypothetical protein